MNNNHIHHGSEQAYDLFLLFPFLAAIIIYLLAASLTSCRYRKWPLSRTIFWILGILCTALVFVGPIANRAHSDFTVHMLGHLFLGMLAPLLIVLAAPMTLVLRALNVKQARLLTRALKSRPVRIVSDPIMTSLLNVGGLWILYTTNLYAMMHDSFLLYFVIHVHVFLAGYLFTISIIYIDPTPHRSSYLYRAIVLIIALAAHGMLSKYIYAHPPAGVPEVQAEIGGMLMYYGGDLIDLFLIFLLCLQWFRESRPRDTSHGAENA